MCVALRKHLPCNVTESLSRIFFQNYLDMNWIMSILANRFPAKAALICDFRLCFHWINH